MATIDEIKQQAEAVKNATQVGENTAERVGGALAGLADIIDENNTKVSNLSFSPISINTKGTIYNGNLITSDPNAFADSIYHEILSDDIFVRYSNYGDYPKLRVTFYDKNKGYLSSTTYDRHTKISKPSNAKFVRFSISVEQENMELDAIDKNLVQLKYVEDKETQLLDVKKEMSNELSRIAAIYVGNSKKCIKFTKENVEGVQHIKLYVKGGDVYIIYGNGKRISIDEDQTVDYTNTIGRKMFFVAIDVVTKNFSIKVYDESLGENEFFLFGFNSIFGANLPLDWVEYEGFDNNILSNKLSNLSSSLNDLSFSPISINTKGTIYNGNLITSDTNAFADSIYHEILSDDIFVRYSNNGDYPKLRVTFYDKNRVYLSSTTYDRHTKISKPRNAKFVRFSINVEQENMELDAIDKNLVQLKYVEDKETQLLDVKKEIEEKIDNKHTENVLSLNESSRPAIVSMSSRPLCNYSMVNIGVLPVFLLMTDLHSDQSRFVRGMQFLNYHQQIFAGIMLGDTFDSTRNIFDFENIVTSCTKKPVISVCGNHEVLCRKEVNIKGMSDTDFINTFFPSSLDKQNSVVRPDGKCYWYKDFKSNLASEPKKIRIIGLHQYDFQAQKDSDGYTIDGEQGSGKGKDITYYSQEQIDWLVNLLDNTDENTYVAIVEHYAMTKEMTLVDTEWNPSSYINQPIEGGSNTGGADNMTNNNFFPEIIQKWIDGGTVEVSNTYKNDNVNVSVNHTFVAHRKQFIGYFSGHTHRDGVYKLTEYPSQHQFMLNLSSVSDGLNSSDIGRSIYGKSQDCFTLVSYDWYNHRVNLLRIGADVTTDMRDRKMCSISLGG